MLLCFSSWAKSLHQRRVQSLSSAAESLQLQMLSIEHMFDTRVAEAVSERDILKAELLAEKSKVNIPSFPPPGGECAHRCSGLKFHRHTC
jgi:hypothetical protein